MCCMPFLPWRLVVRLQNPTDEGNRRSQLRSFSHGCLSLDRNRTEHRLTHHAPMNPQLLGDPANRSTAMLILTSNLLEYLHLASPVHPASPRPTEPKTTSTEPSSP